MLLLVEEDCTVQFVQRTLGTTVLLTFVVDVSLKSLEKWLWSVHFDLRELGGCIPAILEAPEELVKKLDSMDLSTLSACICSKIKTFSNPTCQNPFDLPLLFPILSYSSIRCVTSSYFHTMLIVF